MNKKILSIFLVMVVLVNMTTGVIAGGFEDSITWKQYNLKEGEVFKVYFPYKVNPENITTPDGILYKGYDQTTGEHLFEALRDLTDVKGSLYYSKDKGTTETEQGGGSGEVGEIGDGEATGRLPWEDMEFIKQGWGSGEEVIYSIKVDLQDYDNGTVIIIEDTATDNNPYNSELEIRYLRNDNGYVETLDKVDYAEISGNTSFRVEIEKQEFFDALDLIYTTKPEGEDYGNTYRILTKEEWEQEQSGGEITGENKPEDEEDIEDEEHTETPEDDVEDKPNEDEDQEIEEPKDEEKEEELEDGKEEEDIKEDEEEKEHENEEEKEEPIEEEKEDEIVEDEEEPVEDEKEDENYKCEKEIIKEIEKETIVIVEKDERDEQPVVIITKPQNDHFYTKEVENNTYILENTTETILDNYKEKAEEEKIETVEGEKITETKQKKEDKTEKRAKIIEKEPQEKEEVVNEIVKTGQGSLKKEMFIKDLQKTILFILAVIILAYVIDRM